MNEKIKYLIILLVLLIPTWFINNNDVHDWGDDFAQYIYQSKKLNHPGEEVKTVLNNNEYGSPKRSLVFSEILSFVADTGHIKPYKQLIALFYVLGAAVVFLFLTTEFSALVSLLLTLCAYYNYHTLRLKGEVVPEFVFMTFLYWILYLSKSQKKLATYLIPVLLACLICIRTIGIVFVIAYLVQLFSDKERTTKEKLIDTLFILLATIFLVISINFLVLAKVSNMEISFYKDAFFRYFDGASILSNLQAYWRSITVLFEQEVPFWINPILIYFSLVLMAIGIFKSIRSISMMGVGFFLYMLVLIIYPYHGTALRFLIPIFPFIFYYIAKALTLVLSISEPLKKHSVYIIPFFLVFILLSNTKTVLLDLRSAKSNSGPYDPGISADLKKVKGLTSPESSIAFCKPFIINLFCERNSYFVTQANCNTIYEKADYILLPKAGHIEELNDLTTGVTVNRADSTELDHFYLLKPKR